MLKTKTTILVLLLVFVAYSCATTKNIASDSLYDTTWELEYISGPRIAFEGLFPGNEPRLSFEKENKIVSGNNGCNGYSSSFLLTGNSISFGEPGPQTMMYCGEGEAVFMSMMKKINKYQFDKDGKLSLMLDDVALMRFKKMDVSTTSNSIDKSTLETETTEEMVAKDYINIKPGVYFEATGTEPFWSLEISDQEVKLKTLTDTLVAPYQKPMKATGMNIKVYELKSATSELNIQIVQDDCSAISGEVLPYKVRAESKKDSEKTSNKLTGCGKYITDYRLYDLWVLEKLNGKMVDTSDFTNNLPAMEINTSTNVFTGFAGCNTMNGKLFFEKELIRFVDIATTRMMCHDNKEDEFLKALRSTITYKIENNRLYLSNPNGELLVFKKVD